jgi:hypothetical protein
VAPAVSSAGAPTNEPASADVDEASSHEYRNVAAGVMTIIASPAHAAAYLADALADERARSRMATAAAMTTPCQMK